MPESFTSDAVHHSQRPLGFLGGGQMAFALAKGAIQSGLCTPEQLFFSEPSKPQQLKLTEAFVGCSIVANASALFASCNRVLLAVKPQILREIAEPLKAHVRKEHCLMSIAAGIRLDQLIEWFGTKSIVRVMPNTPAQVLAGASGMAFGEGVSHEDRKWATEFLESVGTVVQVSDSQLHAVTALSGSGPAYVLLLIEAMADGGVAAGLSREVASALAIQTVLGTAKLAKETGQHPAALKDQVASPGGTTIAALNILEQRAVRAAIIDAIQAAMARSKELAN